MILVVCGLSFLFVFFLTLSASNILHGKEDRLATRIAERVKEDLNATRSVKIEKKERLSDLPFFNRFLKELIGARKLQSLLTQAGFALTLGTFILLSLLLGALGFFLMVILQAKLFITLIAASVISISPTCYALLQRKERMKKFSNHFPDAIGMLASSLRAGYSLQMALGTIVEGGETILASEFSQILYELEVGKNFEEALKNILNRIDTPDLRLFISAVILQRETGGNLAELLDNLEGVIRDRQQLKRELKAATAQARFSGIVLSLLPIFVGFFVYLVHPDYILFFFRESIGVKLLIGCGIGQVLGLLSVQKIVNIEL